MSRKSDKTMPTVIDGILYTEDQNTGLKVGSTLWDLWLLSAKSFYVQVGDKTFSMRCEPQRNGMFWYAYKRTDGKLSKRYVGKPEKITIDRLKSLF